MALRTSLTFAFNIVGDGTDTTLSVNMATGPITWNSGSNVLSAAFQGMPAVVTIDTAGGLTVSGQSLILGILTLTFAAAPANGQAYTLTGHADY